MLFQIHRIKGTLKSKLGKGDAIFFGKDSNHIKHIGMFNSWIDKEKGSFWLEHASSFKGEVVIEKYNIDDIQGAGIIDQDEKQ